VLDLQIQSEAPRVARDATPPAHGDRLVVASRSSAERPELEAFIRAGFARSHGASIRQFMPVLIGMRTACGRIVGVAGCRPAAREALFLEQYLDGHIEDIITRHYPRERPRREEIAEIGNFACADGPTAMKLIGVLAEFLLDQQQRWVAFTATRTVRRITRQLGIALTEIGRADPARLTGSGDDWGVYYATDPRVMLGYVPSWSAAAGRMRSC
jgi:hypothetical protein